MFLFVVHVDFIFFASILCCNGFYTQSFAAFGQPAKPAFGTASQGFSFGAPAAAPVSQFGLPAGVHMAVCVSTRVPVFTRC